MKQTLTIAVLITTLAGSSYAAQKTAAESYQEMSKLMAAGKVEAALAMMTDTAKDEYLRNSLFVLADAQASGEKLQETYTLPDGSSTTATTKDLGFDKVEFPKWLTADSLPSEDIEYAFVDLLLAQADKVDDRAKFFRSLSLMSDHLQGSDFGGEIVDPAKGYEAIPNRVWAKLKFEEDGEVVEEETLPFLFKKVGDQWKFDSLDYDVLDDLMMRHVERKNLKINGMTVEGKKITLSDYKGKVVLIDFWGTW